MSKKDYELIAKTIKKHFNIYLEYYIDSDKNWHLSELIQSISDSLSEDNNSFDRTKFLKACGLEL